MNSEDLEAIYADISSIVGDKDDAVTKTRRMFADSLKTFTPEQIAELPTEAILGPVIKAATNLGVVEDIAGKYARNIRRLKGESLEDTDLNEIFAEYKLKLPPLDIDFSKAADEEIDDWSAKAKAYYNVKMRTKSPALLATRDEVFQRIDDTSKYLKRKAGATDNAFLDFIGRVAEGAGTVADSIVDVGIGDFIKNHSATNPDWDSDTSSLIGQGIGNAAALVGAVTGVGALLRGAGAIGGISASTLGSTALIARTAFNGTAQERYEQVLQATGNEELANEATNTSMYYVEAGLDFLADSLLLGAGKGASKLAKQFATAEGKNSLASSLGTALAKGNKEWLKKAATTGGDIVKDAAREGVTEAAQGFIQQEDLQEVTQDKKFSGYDLTNRAQEFIAGAAGGAFASGTLKFITPSRKLDTSLNTASDDSLVSQTLNQAQSVVSKAVESVKPVVDSTLSLIKEQEIPNKISTIYKGIKDSLGSLLESDIVQNSVDALGAIYDKYSKWGEIENDSADKTIQDNLNVSTGISGDSVVADVIDGSNKLIEEIKTNVEIPTETPTVETSTETPTVETPTVETPTVETPKTTLSRQDFDFTKLALAEPDQVKVNNILDADPNQDALSDNTVNQVTRIIGKANIKKAAPKVASSREQGVTEFFNKVLPATRRGGDRRSKEGKQSTKISLDYLNSQQATDDLLNLGVDPVQVKNSIDQLKSVLTSPIPARTRSKRLAKIKDSLTLLKPVTAARIFSPQTIKDIVKFEYPNATEEDIDAIINSQGPEKAALDSLVERAYEKAGEPQNEQDIIPNLQKQAVLEEATLARNNTGAIKPYTSKTAFDLKRIYDALGEDVEVAELEQPVDSTQEITGTTTATTVRLSPRTLGSTQAPTTLMHELGEVLVRDTSLLKELKGAEAEAKAISDETRFTPTNNLKENYVDAIARYLDNPRSLENYPILKSKLDNSKSKKLKKFRRVIAKEESLPLATKLAERAEQAAVKAKEARESLKTRSVDNRTIGQKLKAIGQEIRVGLFNKQGPLLDIVEKLPPLYEPLKQTLKRHLEQFKNKTERVNAIKSFLGSSYIKLNNLGISIDTLNNYLQSSRIANEINFWESEVPKDSGEQIANTLATLPSGNKYATELVLADLRSNVPAKVIKGINEFARAVIIDGARQDVQQELNRSGLDNSILQPLLGSFLSDSVLKANPGLIDRETAQADLDRIRSSLNPEQLQALNQFSENLALQVARLARELRDAGGIGENTYKYYELNKGSYASFQLADALIDDPYVDSALRGRTTTGLQDEAAGAFEVTTLKLMGLAAKVDRLNFQNSSTSALYAAQNYGGPKIRPIRTTGDAWNNLTGSEAPVVPITEFFTDLKNKVDLDPEKSYLINAVDGIFTLHEIDSDMLNQSFTTGSSSPKSDTINFLNNLQFLTRTSFTTYNPVFALKTALRIASRLHTIKDVSKNGFPSFSEAMQSFINAPLIGVPHNKADRDSLLYFYKLAGDYIDSKTSVQRRADALKSPFDMSIKTLMNDPEILFKIEQAGLLPISAFENLATGIDPNVNRIRDEFDEIIEGKPRPKNLFNLINESNLLPTAVKTASRAIQNTLNYIAETNNRLEIAEKLAGVEGYLQRGLSLDQAFVEANRFFGNPDPRGGGTLKYTLSPVFAFAGPALQSMRVFKDVVAKGVTGKDQRLLSMSLLSLRNQMLSNPLVYAGAAYALTYALTGDSEEAKKTAEVYKKFVENVPKGVRNTGLAIPLFFRNSTNGDWIDPMFVNSPEAIDPAWQTVYLQFPLDQTSLQITGILGGLIEDLVSGNEDKAAANLVRSSFRSTIPAPGPIPQALSAIYQVGSSGQNPIDFYTGRPALSDNEFKQGGIAAASELVQYLISEFIPAIPYSRKTDTARSKIFNPTGVGIIDTPFDMLRLGILNASNYGAVEQQIKDTLTEQVKSDLKTSANDNLLRYNELKRLAQTRREAQRNELMLDGIAPSSIKLKTEELLSPEQNQEYKRLSIWKNGVYNTLLEQAEMELRANGKSAKYRNLLEQLNEATP